ncbi:uncharacterized protein BDZ99DRAFT_574827 [Mytilinidion resinicola]|uniref:Uncharacterized protein n=1 Tax=Mytilinidion resinicola TaxID=574789 RepID=A0A6A6Y9J0_9PEZI|nr:uncharacterized protein BDZ99DRAFT_574827 [Mytilinidion resinicola]KAF2805228.1 hypothetical protein BDZ99DRAFT_574827 [Mytilinidion resinicola]
MADLDQRLSRELARILLCPYPASLQRLNDILADADGPAAVTAWIDQHPCQVARLCSVATNALPLWPSSLKLLQCLCHAAAFRACLLRQEPCMLDDLLTKANASLHGFHEYSQICVLFLSEPLPESVPLPAAAQSFFLRVFDEASQTPCVTMLAPVYAMLKGACRDLIGLLPQNTRDDFDQQICRILASKHAQKDSMLLLWCLGIVVLAEGIPVASELKGPPNATLQDVPPILKSSQERTEVRWSSPAARRLFDSVKAMTKTTTMTVLSVIWACKSSCGDGITDAEAAEGIRIAIRTLQSVDVDVRHEWSHSSSLTKSMLPKLVEKSLRPEIHPLVQLEAFGFLGTLLGHENIPKEVVAQYNRTLEYILLKPFATIRVGLSLSVSIPIFAHRFDDNMSKKLFQDLLNATTRTISAELLEVYRALSSQLTATMPACAVLRKSLLLSISSNDMQHALDSFLGDAIPPGDVLDHNSGDVCNNHAVASKRALVSTLLIMILTATLTTQIDESRLPTKIAISLLEMQSRITGPSNTCPQTIETHQLRSRLSVFEQSCTPRAVTGQPNWRDRLALDLQQQSAHQRDMIVHTVAQVCQQLEERCDHVEKPLREEQRKVEELEAQVTKLKDLVSTLESEAIDRKLLVDGIEGERMQWELDLQQAESRNDRLSNEFSTSLEDMRQKLEEAERETNHTRAGFEAREIKLRADLLSTEEILQQRTGQVGSLEIQIKQLQADLESRGAELERIRQLHESLTVQLHELHGDLELARQDGSRQTNQIAGLVVKEGEITTYLENAKQELADKTRALEKLHEDHLKLESASRDQLASAESKYRTDLENVAAQANEEAARLNKQIEDAVGRFDELKQTHEELLHEMDLDRAAISELESENDQLRDSCIAKDEELDALKALKKRVLSTMGVDSASPMRSTRSQNEASNLALRRQREIRPRPMLQPHQRNGSTEPSGEAITSRGARSPSSPMMSPTMKRAKAGCPFEAPQISLPRPNTGARTSKSMYTHKDVSQRRPLADASARGNQSPRRRRTTIGFEITENQKSMGQEDTMESASFPSGMFTSTPLTPQRRKSDLGQLEGRQVPSGETTWEF